MAILQISLTSRYIGWNRLTYDLLVVSRYNRYIFLFGEITVISLSLSALFLLRGFPFLLSTDAIFTLLLVHVQDKVRANPPYDLHWPYYLRWLEGAKTVVRVRSDVMNPHARSRVLDVRLTQLRNRRKMAGFTQSVRVRLSDSPHCSTKIACDHYYFFYLIILLTSNRKCTRPPQIIIMIQVKK